MSGPKNANPKITLHRGDLPADVSFGASVAIDTETLGLDPHRDRLCLAQFSAGDNSAHRERAESARIAHRKNPIARGDHQRERAFNPAQRIGDRIG